MQSTVTKRGKRGAETEGAALVAEIAAKLAPRAGGFIVTLYGDVVEPRGLPLWMGHIIEICGRAGISETLVRTAVSRLVAAGRLIGDRQGRRSYYRLTDEARQEFAHAAKILFEPTDARGWRLIWVPGDAGLALDKAGFIRLGGPWLMGPADGPEQVEILQSAGAVIFEAVPQSAEHLPVLVAAEWNVAQWDAAYTNFINIFSPLNDAIEAGVGFEPAACLQLRLFLVHAYRLAALRDPHLPRAALPKDWSGARARTLFAILYGRLSPDADRFAASLQSSEGLLPASTPIVQRRQDTLLATLR